ncbi:MAG: hypothetical protein LBU92_00860 [Prevotellaceae bacterium]|jgi:hypothetical protein|nr:hypothetical protein [Prevotellaceae bacterium]
MKKMKTLLAAAVLCASLSAMAEMPKAAVATERNDGWVLVDFGKECVGLVTLHGLKGKGSVAVYYAASREAALDTAANKTHEKFIINHSMPADWEMKNRQPLRYAYVVYPAASNITLDAVSMTPEYLPSQQQKDVTVKK